MAITSNSYTGNGSTTLYSFTFPYLDESHVKVTLAGALTTAYTFANATTIQFNTAPGAGVAIRIYRETNNDQTEATFFAGSSIKAQDLNNNFTQTLYTVQEVVDRYLSKVGDTMQGILNMGGFKITNLGAPTSGTDATTKTYVDTQDALKVSKAGDTMSGNLAMGGNKVTGLGSPSGSADAATKSYVDGYINTTYLGPSATDPTTRPGGAPLQVGDQYFNTNQNILKAWTGTVWVISAAAGSIVRWRKTASAGNTTLSGVDDLGITLSYVVGNEQVYLNGALQTRGVDYTAATGTSITFTPALLAGDVVELHAVQGYVSATVPDGSVGETKLAAGAVTSAKIADGTIVNADVNASAGIGASKLAFTQSGAGATARTVDSKLKDVVSVKDFGAVGDGVADDTAAIQAAIAASLAGRGGVVFFPPGVYCFNQTLYLYGANKGISLVGSGESLAGQNNAPTVLKWTGGSSIAVDVGTDCRNSGIRFLDFENTGTCTAFVRVGLTDHFFIERVNIRPTVFPSTAAIILGIAANNPGRCDHAILRDVNIYGNGIGQIGVLADRAQDCRMFNVQMLACRLVLGMSGSMDIVDFQWFGGSISTFTDEPAAAIEIKQCRGATFHGLHMERNGGSAAFLEVSGSGTTDARGINVYGGYVSGTSTTSQIFRLNWVAADVLISGVTTVQLAPAYNFVNNIASRSVTLIGNSLVAGATEVSGATGYSNVVAFGNVIDSLRQTPKGLVTASLVTATNGDTSPSVRGLNSLWFNNSSSTTITNLDDAIDGQVVTCVFNDSNTTINRSNAYLLNGTNFTSTAGDTLTLIYRTPYWYEISRSANS